MDSRCRMPPLCCCRVKKKLAQVLVVLRTYQQKARDHFVFEGAGEERWWCVCVGWGAPVVAEA